MKIAISAESTIDLPQELLDKYGIHTTPFGINMGGELIDDRFGISSEIFEYVKQTGNLPKTSAISPEQYSEYFTNLLKEYDAVVHITLSSQLSCANNNANLIARDLDNVFIIDSKSLSTGIALLAIYACSLRDKKKSAEDIYKMTLEKVDSVQASFVIETLKFLHKGGRCSALALLGANILKIKPQISLVNGKMNVAKKFRGNLNKVLDQYCDELLSENANPDLETVFITSSSEMADIKAELSAKLSARGFKNIYETLAGGTISSHCGPNCLGVLFLNK
ncbi:MAG: DegV family protein [Clostridiales bacterium]|nr:DegV family protein [Clostridiales bacterium]